MRNLEPNLALFVGKYPLRKFKKNQTIMFQGEVPRFVYFLAEGTVKVYNINSSGEEQIISLNTEKDIFPEAWIMDVAPVATYFYEAFTDCEVYTIPKEDLVAELENNQSLSQHMINRLTRLYTGARIHINALEQPRSRDKLMQLLQFLMLKFGTEQNNWVRVDLKLTHQTLANMVGVTRETIAVELSKLRREGIINYKQQVYNINKKKLIELRNEEEIVQEIG